MSGTASENLARWVEATNYSDIPQEIVNIAKRNILDFIGVTLAGSREPVAKILERYLRGVEGSESTVIGLGVRTSSIEAAFADGVIGHCLDYDDLVIPKVGAGGPHITATTLPAGLVIAEKDDKTGRQLIESYILGCEVVYRVSRAVDPTHYNAGWHTTGTEGIFGATVAASKLLGSSCEEIAYSLGIAGSEASGLRENNGTMTKPFHAGQAGAKGVKAALLSRLGFTSSKTIFEGKDGFCNVVSNEPKVDEITSNLDQFCCMPRIRLKLYPCCAGSHSAIYATLELVKKHDISSDDVESIEVKCDPQVAVILTYSNPKTATEGMFSIQFPLALAISEKKLTLQEFTDEKIKEPGIVELMKKVKLIPDPELRAKCVHSRTSIVEIKLKSGSCLVSRCDHPPGTPQNPISDEDILEKYRTCARLVLTEKEIDESIKCIMNLETLDSIGRLVELLSRGG